MSAPFPVRQESDDLPRRWLFGIAAGALVTVVAAVCIAVRLGATARVTHVALGPYPSSSAPNLELGLFEQEGRGLALQRQQRARLARYGWVDRNAGIVHIPIERAMQLSLEQKR